MNSSPTPSQPAGLDLSDIYFVLFRHKWKILVCSLLGFGIAAAMFRNEAPPFQSEAKLLVRYIVTDSKSGGPNASGTSKILPDERGASIMNTEVEILTSLDLAREVAQSIGPERIMAKVGGGKDLGAATNYVKGNLSASPVQGSSVLHVVFKHPDPELVQPVLQTVIERYFKRHVDAHHATGIVGDSLAQEADTLRARLAETEDQLRKATKAAGVVSLGPAKETLANQITATRREIFNYEADLASQLAVYEDLKRRVPAADATARTEQSELEVPFEAIEEFKRLSAQIQRRQLREQDLLTQFQPETDVVKQAKQQRIEAETELKKLRDKYPKLTRATAPGDSSKIFDSEANQLAATWTQITGYQAKIKELNSQLERLRAESAKLEQMEGTILELTRTKELQEANYRYYAANLEQSRISESVGSGKVSNITQIQTPSTAFRDRINTKKIGVVAVSGVIVGLGWAFLLELFLDRSVRRPADLNRMLRTPLLLSIPQLKPSARLSGGRQLALTNGNGAAAIVEDVDPTANGTLPTLGAFHDTLRDRLVSFFESRNLTHKPKLITVTSLRAKAGVTSTATGLARSLSETGDGNVLLVDMTTSQGSAQEFSRGKKAPGLEEMLEGRAHAHVHENLYVVSELNNSERLSRNLPQRFNKLIPKLKASDFDYIIFDMPPVNQLSITPRLANFMDMVLLVVESEKTDRELVQGACDMLAESKTHVGLVLNKTRNYVPSRLQQQLAHQ